MKPGMYFKAGEENPLFDFQQKYSKHVEAGDITYEDYLIYEQMDDHKKFFQSGYGYGNGMWYAGASIAWAICALVSGILVNPWLFFEFLCCAFFGGIAICDLVDNLRDKEHKKYHQLYKYFKKNKLWDKLKSYMQVYVCSDRFSKDKAEYEYKQANEKLENYISHAAYDINNLSDNVKELKHEYEQHLSEQECTPDVKFEVGEDKIIVHKDDTSELNNNMAVGGIIRKLMAKLADKKVANVEIKFNEVEQSAPEADETEQITTDEINK